MKHTIMAIALCVASLHLTAAESATRCLTLREQLEAKVARLRHDLAQAEQIRHDLTILCTSKRFNRPDLVDVADDTRTLCTEEMAKLLHARMSIARYNQELALVGTAHQQRSADEIRRDIDMATLSAKGHKLQIEKLLEAQVDDTYGLIDIVTSVATHKEGWKGSFRAAVNTSKAKQDYAECIDRAAMRCAALFGYLGANQTYDLNLCLRSFNKSSLIDAAASPYCKLDTQTDPAAAMAAAASSAPSTGCELRTLEQQVELLARKVHQTQQENDDLMAVLTARKHYFYEFKAAQEQCKIDLKRLFGVKADCERLRLDEEKLGKEYRAFDPTVSQLRMHRIERSREEREMQGHEEILQRLELAQNAVHANWKLAKEAHAKAQDAQAAARTSFKQNLMARAAKVYSTMATIAKRVTHQPPAALRTVPVELADRAQTYAEVLFDGDDNDVQQEALWIQGALYNARGAPAAVGFSREPDPMFAACATDEDDAEFADLDHAARRGPVGPLAVAAAAASAAAVLRPAVTTQLAAARHGESVSSNKKTD